MKHRITTLLLAISLLLTANVSQASVEEGLNWLQQGERDLALAAMQSQIEAQDPAALFWQARIYMKMGGMQTFQIGSILQRAAELGNPWAMMELVESPYEHCQFFRLPCDDKWHDKAIEKWQQMAKNGDGKAMYMLAKHKDSWRKYVPYLAHKTRVEQYIQALEMGANRASTAIYSELVRHQDRHQPEIRQQIVKYLTIAAERGYAPAMVYLYEFADVIRDNIALEYLQQATELGYAQGPFNRYFHLKKKENKNHKDWKILYKSIKLASSLNASKYLNSLEYLDYGNHLSAEDVAQIDQEVAEFLTQVKPNRFYDETNLY